MFFLLSHQGLSSLNSWDFLLLSAFIALWNETQESLVDGKKEDRGLIWAMLQLTCAWNRRPVNPCGFIICSVSVHDADKASVWQHCNQTQYLYRLAVLCTTTLTSVFSLVWCKLSIFGIFASRARGVVVFFFFTKILAMIKPQGRSARTDACLMPVSVKEYRRIVTVLDVLCVCTRLAVHWNCPGVWCPHPSNTDMRRWGFLTPLLTVLNYGFYHVLLRLLFPLI